MQVDSFGLDARDDLPKSLQPRGVDCVLRLRDHAPSLAHDGCLLRRRAWGPQKRVQGDRQKQQGITRRKLGSRGCLITPAGGARRPGGPLRGLWGIPGSGPAHGATNQCFALCPKCYGAALVAQEQPGVSGRATFDGRHLACRRSSRLQTRAAEKDDSASRAAGANACATACAESAAASCVRSTVLRRGRKTAAGEDEGFCVKAQQRQRRSEGNEGSATLLTHDALDLQRR